MKSEKYNKTDCDPSTGCCDSKTSYSKKPILSIERRDFMRAMGVVFGGMTVGLPTIGKAQQANFPVVSKDKDFDSDWLKSLYERGTPEVFSGKELVYIGMPVGGLTAGQVYLGGVSGWRW